jgi:hypothetical protein
MNNAILLLITNLLFGIGLFTTAVGQTGPPADRVRPLRFRLSLDSLQPSRITVPEGTYLIQVVNAAVMADITVRLDDERSIRVADGRTRKGGSKSVFVARLRPGRHRISVPGRPAWQSEIVVTQR